GIAVELARRALHCLERGGKRRERPLVRRELDDPLEAELALDVLDGLPRLVRRQLVDRRPKEVPRRAHPAILEPPRRAMPRCQATDTKASQTFDKRLGWPDQWTP